MGAPDEAAQWATTVFTVADASYTWSDVADFAKRGDGWNRLLAEIRDGLACRRAGYVPTPAAVDAAARSFRYDRRLITGDETRAWLVRRSLDVSRWMDFIRREVLLAEHAPAIPVAAIPAADVDALVWAQGWCGGHFEAMSLDLAQRVAAHTRLHGAPPADLPALDSVLNHFRDAVVTPEGLQTVVARRRMDWLNVHLEQAAFESDDAAREAAMSVRVDGMSIAEVCALAGVPQVHQAARLEELDPALRTAVLAAREGETLDPVKTAEGFVVARVESKTLPSLDDPGVRGRATAEVTATALRQQVEERVRWHDR